MIGEDSPLQGLAAFFHTVFWSLLPPMPIGQFFADLVDWCTDNLEIFFDLSRDIIDGMIVGLTDGLLFLPATLMVLVFTAIAFLVRGWRFGIITFFAMGLVAWSQFWIESMQTLALVLIASILALIIAVPVGILAAENATMAKIVRPVLDFMQTMPAFVYLIPAVAFYGIGDVPGVIATIVFCMPPGVRLTELGIRQVDSEVVEAGESFGARPATILTRIKLPLALPTIMAGVNQVIMLALSMVVIAGMVGGEGLGKVIMAALNNVDLAKGFDSGLAVVIIAIFLDRVTDSLSKRTKVARVAAMRSKS